MDKLLEDTNSKKNKIAPYDIIPIVNKKIKKDFDINEEEPIDPDVNFLKKYTNFNHDDA
jgi:hypothetical protein